MKRWELGPRSHSLFPLTSAGSSATGEAEASPLVFPHSPPEPGTVEVGAGKHHRRRLGRLRTLGLHGVNVYKTFFLFVTDDEAKQALLLVLGKP